MANNSNKKALITFIILQVLLILVAFGSGYLVRDWLPASRGKFPILTEAFQILESNGLKDIPSLKTLEYGMIRGMVDAYEEPYTVFVEPPQHELQTNQLQGKFGGIGARLEKDSSGNVLIYPFLDSPAAIAGIQEGDQLISVEELQITRGTSMEEIQAAIRGPVGKKVTMTIARTPDYSPIQISVERQEVNLPTTTWNIASEDTSVGVVQINIIAETTPEEVDKAVNDLISRGAGYIILDLRDNRGGMVDAGIDTARLFLKEGVVMEQQYRDKPVKSFSVNKPGPFTDIPLAVIVNQNTASAAEIISGALQGQNRAVLVGVETYGKDSIQLIYDLQDGSSLHVTAARWWIPHLDFPLEDHGLTPDIIFTDTDSYDPIILQSAIDNLIK